MPQLSALGVRAAIATIGALSLSTVACEAHAPPPRMASSSAANEGFATCPHGSTVVGGGYEIDAKLRASGHPPVVVASRPTETGWKVECVDAEGKTVSGCRAYVLCASVL